MTLSRWLRDYLYIPLGGNRGSGLMTYRNLMLTMILGGLWHGAAWTFVIWGAIHGGALAVERSLREKWAHSSRQAYFSPAVRPVVQWIATFNVVCLAWVFFRSSSLSNAWTMLGRLTVWGEPTQLASLAIVAVITGAIATQFVSIGTVHHAQAALARMSWAVQGAVFGVALVVIDVLGPEGVAPFIYFQF
jgi:D-alanyl-lipoteichoic acid acyltransferase DltB (MBOAT superfamily)